MEATMEPAAEGRGQAPDEQVFNEKYTSAEPALSLLMALRMAVWEGTDQILLKKDWDNLGDRIKERLLDDPWPFVSDVKLLSKEPMDDGREERAFAVTVDVNKAHHAVYDIIAEETDKALAAGEEPCQLEGVRLTKEKALAGDRSALRDVGRFYFNGEGVKADDATAAYWWEKGAKLGDPQCQLFLGTLLRGGRVGGQDHAAKALHWFFLAAEQGDPEAQFALAGAYLQGQGTMPDEIRGMYWLEKAANAGVANARLALARTLNFIGDRQDT